MIQVLPTIKSAYRQDSTFKSTFVLFRDLGIMKKSNEIISESLNITESICSSGSFKVGLCEASHASISVVLEDNVKGDEMTIFQTIGQFDPEITVDETKGLQLSGDGVTEVISQAFNGTSLFSGTGNFESEKNYLILAKIEYTGEIYLYVETPNRIDDLIYYLPTDLNIGETVQIALPIVGNDFNEYEYALKAKTAVSGYLTVYEIDYPILPLGLYGIDSCRKENNSIIRDLTGYDRMLNGDLETNENYNVDGTETVGDILNQAAAGTQILVGNNLTTSYISAGAISYTEENLKSSYLVYDALQELRQDGTRSIAIGPDWYYDYPSSGEVYDIHLETDIHYRADGNNPWSEEPIQDDELIYVEEEYWSNFSDTSHFAFVGGTQVKDGIRYRTYYCFHSDSYGKITRLRWGLSRRNGTIYNSTSPYRIKVTHVRIYNYGFDYEDYWCCINEYEGWYYLWQQDQYPQGSNWNLVYTKYPKTYEWDGYRIFRRNRRWIADVKKITATYQIENYSSGYEYHVKLYDPETYGVIPEENAERNKALEYGSLQTDNQTALRNSIIQATSTEPVTVDENGRFTITYVTPLVYSISGGGYDPETRTISQGSILDTIKINRQVENFNEMVAVPAKTKFNAKKRNVISAFLELNGYFINFDRYGTSEYLTVTPAFTDTTYPANNAAIIETRNEEIELVEDIELHGYKIIELSDLILIESTDTEVSLPSIGIRYQHTYNIDDVPHETETNTLVVTNPVYKVGEHEFNERITVETTVYTLDFYDPDGIYTVHVESDLPAVIDFENSIRDMALEYGSLDVDRQSEVLALLNNYDEKVDTEVENNAVKIRVSRIQKIEYFGDSEGEYEAENSVVYLNAPITEYDNPVYTVGEDKFYEHIIETTKVYQIPDYDEDLEYTIAVESDLSTIKTYENGVRNAALALGQLDTDRQSELLSIIDGYDEKAELFVEDGIATVVVSCISKIESWGYDAGTQTAESILRSVAYLGDIDDNPVYGKGYTIYKETATASTVKYRIPDFTEGDRATVSFTSEKSSVITAENSVRTMALTLGMLDIDRQSSAVATINNFPETLSVDVADDGTFEVTYLSKLNWKKIREGIVVDTGSISLDTPFKEYTHRKANSEPIQTSLCRSIYIEDEYNEPFDGIKIVKNNPTENYYPFYFNKDGTTGYVDGANYYVVSNNFYINNYIFTESQLTDICTVMYYNIGDLGYYNLDTTFRALPYLEVGDSIRIIVNDKVYETAILRRTMSGCTAMMDNIEAEFTDD